MEPQEKIEKTIYWGPRAERGENWLHLLFWQIYGLFEHPGRLLIEVFTRRDFGERYFRFFFAVSLFTVLALWPFLQLLPQGMYLAILSDNQYVDRQLLGVAASPDYGWHFFGYLTWYVYLGFFLRACIRHRKAMKRAPSVFDFARYSKFEGRIDKRIVDMAKNFGREGDWRFIQCWLEALPAFCIGLALYALGQHLGWLLMASAVVHSISYHAAYNWGDNQVMDIIDDMIVNRDMEKTFMDDTDPNGSGRYRYLGRKPDDPEKRRVVLDRMLGEEEDVTEAK